MEGVFPQVRLFNAWAKFWIMSSAMLFGCHQERLPMRLKTSAGLHGHVIAIFALLLVLTFPISTPAVDTWEVVGTAGFSAGEAYYLSLALDGSTPYLAFTDVANSFNATVMRLNGSTWEVVGTAGFSAGDVYYSSLALDGSTPYVAYEDVANSYKPTVMRLNGSTWEAVGTAGFSAGAVDYPSLALDGSTPYVAFSDNANSDKATVMRFASSQPPGPAPTESTVPVPTLKSWGLLILSLLLLGFGYVGISRRQRASL